MPSLKFAIVVIIFTLIGGWFLWRDADIDLDTLFAKQSQAPEQTNSPYVNNADIAQNNRKTTNETKKFNQTKTAQNTRPIDEPLRRPSPDDTPVAPTNNQTAQIPIVGERPNYDRKIIERAIGDAVNRQRINRDLRKLRWRKDLARVGRKFSRELVADAQKTLDKDQKLTKIELRHNSAIFGNTHVNRLYTKEVYDFSTAGENIISLPLLKLVNGEYHWKTVTEIADQSALEWTLSPTHMRNILITRYTHTGIGVVLIDNFLVATQLFIAEVDCGYPDGKCCKPNDTNPELFCYGTNICTKQKDDEMKCDMAQ